MAYTTQSLVTEVTNTYHFNFLGPYIMNRNTVMAGWFKRKPTTAKSSIRDVAPASDYFCKRDVGEGRLYLPVDGPEQQQRHNDRNMEKNCWNGKGRG